MQYQDIQDHQACKQRLHGLQSKVNVADSDCPGYIRGIMNSYSPQSNRQISDLYHGHSTVMLP